MNTRLPASAWEYERNVTEDHLHATQTLVHFEGMLHALLAIPRSRYSRR